MRKGLMMAGLGIWVAVASSVAMAQAGGGVLGDWHTPGGSTIEVYRCGSDVCAKVTEVAKDSPSSTDDKNPDAKLRTRPLKGLEIGHGFHLTDASHADDGKLYDPKSGKTYDGSMTSEGDKLKLRGYVGVKLFGRTEVWTRVK